MTTLTDDLHLALSWAQTTYPGVPSEVVGDQVYINFGYLEAVCVGCEFTEHGKVWYATATAWDQSGGVMDEIGIAAGHKPHVFNEVAKFLITQANNEEKLERLLAFRPEDL